MQAETEGICDIPMENFDTTLIPVEFVQSEDILPRTRVSDPTSIVELGKQLLACAKSGDTDMVRDLMCRGAPFTTDWLGTSALHAAAQNNHLETAEVLLRAGISRDARTKVDRTPLHMAAYEGHDQMAQLILNYGAEVDSRDMLKMTPLHWAVEREHAEVMAVLLEHGADPNAISKFNKTPISLALENDKYELLDILQQEREIISIQPNPIQSAEIEAATLNLIKLESEEQRQSEKQVEYVLPTKQKCVSNKKQKTIFQQIKVQPVNEPNQVREFQKIQEKVIHGSSKKYKEDTNFAEIEQPYRLLQAHGLTMIPVDNDPTIVENAMESGQTVYLTEAGKIALNLTKSHPAHSVKRFQPVSSKKGPSKKIITIRADQLLGQNQPTLTSRGPNILKKAHSEPRSASKIFFASLGSAANALITRTPTPVKKATVSKSSEPIIVLNNDDVQQVYEDDNCNREPVMDLVELNKKLAEVRREADEFRRQLREKEEEAEMYRQQIKQLVKRKTMMK